MKCKLCGQDTTLVKAHVIPRCFYEVETFGKHGPSLVSDSPQFSPIKRRIGIYDPRMLCGNCEEDFGHPDDYGCSLLVKQRRDARKVYGSSGVEIAYVYETYDYALLKDFFLSVLLRAELTNDFFFQHVRLGPYRQKLVNYFNRHSPLCEEDFPIFLFYHKEITSGPLIVPPDVMTISGTKFYHFHLGRCGFCVKVDKRPAPTFLAPILLSKNRPLVVVSYKFTGTQIHDVVSKLVNNPNNRKYFSN